MFRITFEWGEVNDIASNIQVPKFREYRLTDEPFETIDAVLCMLPGAVILEVI
jgi:hypothetical protein